MSLKKYLDKQYPGKVFLGLLVSGLALLPCFEFTGLNGYDEKRMYEISVLTVVALVAAWQLNSRFVSVLPWVGCDTGKWLLAAFLAVGFVSALHAIAPLYALLELVHTGLVIASVIAVALYSYYRADIFLYVVFGALACFAGVYTFRVLVEYILHFTTPATPLWPHRISFTLVFDGEIWQPNNIGFENIRFFNHLQTWTLPLMAGGVLMLPSKWWAIRRIIFGVLCFWWVLVFASAARGTMISLLLSAFLIWLLFGKSAYTYIKYLAVSLLIGGLIYLLMYELMIPAESSEMKSIVRSDPSNRWRYWTNALALFKDNWLLGIGPMHYAHTYYNTEVAAPHNMYLQLLVEWGILAFTLLTWIGIRSYSYWIRLVKDKLHSYSKFELYLRMGLTGSLTAALFHAFVSGIMNAPLSQIWGVIVIGWMVGIYLKDNKNEDKDIDDGLKKGYINFAKILLLLIVVSYGYLLYPQLKNSQSRSKEYREHFNTNIVYPRFWNQGKFGFE